MVRSAAFTPDGKKLFTGGGDWRKPERGGEVKVWDLDTGVSTKYPWNKGPVNAVAVSPDGKTFAAGGHFWIELWDADTGKARPLPQVLQSINSIAFAPDSRKVAAGSYPPLVHLWDPLTGKEKGVLKGHTEEIETICFHPDGRTLATGGRDGMVKLWDLSTPSEPQATTLRTFRYMWVNSVAFSGRGKVLAVSAGGTLKLYDPVRAKEITHLLGSEGQGGWRVAFAPRGKLLVTANPFGKVRLWDLAAWNPLVPAGKEDAAKADLERLQGTWFRVSIAHGKDRFGRTWTTRLPTAATSSP
jgi:tricorn protease-like protein